MIPLFPSFKKLELEDKAEIDRIVRGFQPYSDFDFPSMFMWNIEDKIRISSLHNNLIVLFSDYLTGVPFFSFIGTNQPNETTLALLKYTIDQHMDGVIKLLPEEVAVLLDTDLFHISEDRDSFDYIYDTKEHAHFSGGAYANKRKEVNAAIRAYPDIRACAIDLHDPAIRAAMEQLYGTWAGNKVSEDKMLEENEHRSFEVLLNYIEQESNQLSGLGVFVNNCLVAFCIYELTEGDYAIGHSAKSDSAFKGSNAFLMKSLGEVLSASGKKYFNYEQDLGLSNLRTAKERFRPVRFLKKYTVSLK